MSQLNLTKFSVVLCFLSIVSQFFIVKVVRASDLSPYCLTSEVPSDDEKWILEQLRTGEVADLFLKNRKVSSDKSNMGVKLRVRFLQDLLSESCQSILPPTGVRILGGVVDEELELHFYNITKPLVLSNWKFGSSVSLYGAVIGSEFTIQESDIAGDLTLDSIRARSDVLVYDTSMNSVSLENARVDGVLSFYHSEINGIFGASSLVVRGGLYMYSASILDTADFLNAEIFGQLYLSEAKFGSNVRFDFTKVHKNLLMRGVYVHGEMVFRTAYIGGQLSLSNSTFGANISLDAADIKSYLFIRSSRLRKLNIRGTDVGDNFELSDSVFSGDLITDRLDVKGNLIAEGGFFKYIDLKNSTIGGQLNLINANIDSGLDLEFSSIRQTFLLRGAQINNEVNMPHSTVSSIDFSNASLPSVDLTGSKVLGELRFAWNNDRQLEWKDGSRLVLRDVEVSNIVDTAEIWPDHLELDGFTYGLFTSANNEEESVFATRELRWFTRWLNKQSSFSLQSYKYLSDKLEKNGYSTLASDVLYSGKQREMESAPVINKLWLYSSELIIGYGYKPHRSIIWVSLFIVLGALVFRKSEEIKNARMPFAFIYSMDMFLPLIKLRETNYDIDIKGYIRYYLYLHKITGYILASFLVASLSGITKL